MVFGVLFFILCNYNTVESMLLMQWSQNSHFIPWLKEHQFFGGYVFYIDENNDYHRGSLVYLYISILVVSILVLVYGIRYFSNRTQSIMRGTLLAFTVFLVLGIALKSILPRTNYDFLCISVSCLLLLMYYSHATLRVDPLTKLMNRHVY